MDIRILAIATAIISTLLLVASFAIGYTIYHEIQSQLTIELEAKEKSQ